MSLRRRKKQQESEVESWARLDIRIKRARTRHELTRLVMGTIFLECLYVYIFFLYVHARIYEIPCQHDNKHISC